MGQDEAICSQLVFGEGGGQTRGVPFTLATSDEGRWVFIFTGQDQAALKTPLGVKNNRIDARLLRSIWTNDHLRPAGQTINADIQNPHARTNARTLEKTGFFESKTFFFIPPRQLIKLSPQIPKTVAGQ